MTDSEGTFHEIDRWDGGLGWMAYPDENMERASHAIVTDDGVWGNELLLKPHFRTWKTD